MTSFVEFDKVWLAYDDELLAKQQFAVEDITLKVTQGEFIAIVGPSGCGKSTFMKLTTGLKMPSMRSEEHTSELQSLVGISYAVFCLDRKSVV